MVQNQTTGMPEYIVSTEQPSRTVPIFVMVILDFSYSVRRTCRNKTYLIYHQCRKYRTDHHPCRKIPTFPSSMSEKSYFSIINVGKILLVRHPCRKNSLLQTFLYHIMGIETLWEKNFKFCQHSGSVNSEGVYT
jgi:hypothetical protein